MAEKREKSTSLSGFRAGSKVRQSTGYDAFVPETINREWVIDAPELHLLLEGASRALGELNAISSFVPDIDRFMVTHVVKEATVSSRIEGTATTLAEALRPVESIRPERRADWQEVQNYVEALNHAIERLASLPLSNRLIREAHALLMHGVRGEMKTPGEWRRSQNWIGGRDLGSASFIPPPMDRVDELMDDLQRFLQNDRTGLPHLAKIAVAHYQFETIHPFLDGNGRIGRLLIPLYLIDQNLLQKPALYISSTLEVRRDEYYARLTAVREENAMIEWIRFFLEALRDAAIDGRYKMTAITELKRESQEKVASIGARSGRGLQLLDLLFSAPFITVNEARDFLEISYPTANELVKEFVRLGLLVQSEGGSAPRLFVFKAYLDVYEG